MNEPLNLDRPATATVSAVLLHYKPWPQPGLSVHSHCRVRGLVFRPCASDLRSYYGACPFAICAQPMLRKLAIAAVSETWNALEQSGPLRSGT